MKFGAVPLEQAEGATAVHSIRKAGLVLKKGTSIGKAEVEALRAAGIAEIVVARLEPGDVPEDVAAGEIAAAAAGDDVHVDRAFTGRANLFARSAGVLVVDRPAIDALNRVDPAITFATLPAFAPVVPGNLLLIAHARGRPVLGAPGCARSPKENGFDWVLMRLLAGLDVSRDDIVGMGVGGLLMEIITRPQPREVQPAVDGRHVAAILLAAGRSTRMGGPNKLTAELGGRALVRIAAEQALASRASPVVVVTGPDRARGEAALAGLPVRLVHNPDYAQGLSTSLKAGLAALPPQADGAIVCLGDMPRG